MTRLANGRFTEKRMTAIDRIVVLGWMTFTIAIGAPLYYQDHSLVQSARPYFPSYQAQASDRTPDSVIVPSEIVSTQGRSNDEQTAGEITTAAPVSTPSATTEKQQILAYIVEKFGDDAADAIVVIRKCENSSFNPRAINQNRNGSVDRGIFQLNSAYWGGEELFDWKTNVDVAYKVFTRAGKKWTPWTCAHVVDQKNYLNQ